MSRTRLLWFFAAWLALSPMALAKTADSSTHDEIVYRASFGRADDIKILLSQGLSADETDKSGAPLLAIAAGRSDTESLRIVKALVEAKADINKADTRGQTALFYAAKIGNKEVTKYLLEQNIKYAVTDRAGNTARNVAFQAGHFEIVELMDNFVIAKNDEARHAYEEANKQLEERYQAYNQLISQAQKVNSGQETVQNIALQRIKQSIHGISFSSCAMSYWKFCKEMSQPTEMGKNGLDSNILAHRNKAAGLVLQFMKTNKVDISVIEKIINTSSTQITRQLYNMRTNEARAELGVGTIDDMNARCGNISAVWLAKK